MEKIKVNDTTGKILKSFEEWADETAHSSRFFAFYTSLLKLQADTEAQTGIPDINLAPEEIKHRISSRQTLLRADELSIDWGNAQKLFSDIVNLFEQYPEFMDNFPAGISKEQPEISAETVKIWLEGGKLPDRMGETEIEPVIFSTLIHHTIRPFLTGYALAFKNTFDYELWRLGHCPVCGSIPALGYLEKELGARWLICSCCQMHWIFQRVVCAFCGNKEPESQSFRTDDSGLYRLYLCEKCNNYLKAVDLRKSREEINLELEIITTVDLDIQAQELGYTSGEATINK